MVLRRDSKSPGSRPAGETGEITCVVIEAIVFAKLGWGPAGGSAQECAQAAAAVGYAPGLASQIARPE